MTKNKTEQLIKSAEREAKSAREELAQALRDLTDRAAADAGRVAEGQLPWYSAGSFASTGCQIDLLHARVKTADEALRNLRWLAAKDEVA